MFTHTTFAQGKAALKARLQDPNGTHWTDTECGLYLCEALRFWNLAALYFRDRVSFVTTNGTKFYDLQTRVNGTGDAVLTRNTTDREAVNLIQYHLQEHVNDFSVSFFWVGTEMFTMDDVVQALQRRLNRFLFETGVVVQESQQSISAGNGRVSLSQAFIDIVRAAWVQLGSLGAESRISRIRRIDESTAGKQSRRWSVDAGTPVSFSLIVSPNLQIQLVPHPIANGQLHLLTVNTNTALDVATGVTINLPNDLVSAVRWGALADLLGKEGQAEDPDRSAYCEQRYREGVELAKIFPSVMSGEINGVPVQISSVDSFDSHSFRWQSTAGTPQLLALAGLNLLTMTPTPDGIYSVVLDVVRNAILPALDADFIQVGQEYWDVILDYAFHLAMFKEGMTAIQSSMAHYERLMKQAAEYNSRLKAGSQAFDVLMTRAQGQTKNSPIREAA